jgi:hypothetical protein
VLKRRPAGTDTPRPAARSRAPTTRNVLLVIALLAALPMITGYSLWGGFVAGL